LGQAFAFQRLGGGRVAVAVTDGGGQSGRF
jgi:hypothetical protein